MCDGEFKLILSSTKKNYEKISNLCKEKRKIRES